MAIANLNISVMEKRLLKQAEAASYTGLAVKHFKATCPVPLRANKRETIDWLKFTLEVEGERTHGYAFTDTAFARYWV